MPVRPAAPDRHPDAARGPCGVQDVLIDAPKFTGRLRTRLFGPGTAGILPACLRPPCGLRNPPQSGDPRDNPLEMRRSVPPTAGLPPRARGRAHLQAPAPHHVRDAGTEGDEEVPG